MTNSHQSDPAAQFVIPEGDRNRKGSSPGARRSSHQHAGEIVRMALRVPPELRDRLRILAVREDRSLSSVCIEFLSEGLDRWEQRTGEEIH